MDFSALNNEQLLELIRAAMAETVSRGMKQIAEQIYEDAKADAQAQVESEIRAAKAAAEAEAAQAKRVVEQKLKQQKTALQQNSGLWASKASVLKALKAYSAFKEDEELFLNIWQRDGDGEVRVYLKGPEVGRRSHEWEIVFYYTGNKYHPPLSVEGVDDELIPALTEFFKVLCSTWTPGLDVKYSAVKGIEPHPEKLNKYRKALGLPALEVANV
jgi:hypothetical protein